VTKRIEWVAHVKTETIVRLFFIVGFGTNSLSPTGLVACCREVLAGLAKAIVE
jgi:hypothetical protein